MSATATVIVKPGARVKTVVAAGFQPCGPSGGLKPAGYDSTVLNRALRAGVRRADARVIRVGLLGYGRIGQAVAAVAARESARLDRWGIDLRCESALIRSIARARPGAPAIELATSGRDVIASGVDVIVEALGGVEPARTLVSEALALGIPVVTANKSLVAAHGPELRRLAAQHGVPFLCEAAALAGVPCLGALARRPLASAVRSIAGLVNGTTHFILNAIAAGATFEYALAEAQARGYAEPDSTADVSGRDAAEKLTLLLHLAGCDDARTADLTTRGIEAIASSDFACARALGGTIKPVALATIGANEHDESGAWVGPAFVADAHPFARLDGVTNAIALRGDHGRESCFVGPGAGPEITAATIIDDIVEAVSGADSLERSLSRAGHVPPLRDTAAAPRRHAPSFISPSRSAWFLRLANGEAFSVRDVAECLAAHHAPAVQIVEVNGSIAARTVCTSWATISEIVGALNACGAGAVTLPVLDVEARA